MDLSRATFAHEQVIQAPRSIKASTYDDWILLSVEYKTEKERDEIKFKLPRGANLLFNEPWYRHAWWRPRDISNATVAVFEYLGTKYTLARVFVG